jgi:hypothetical protein
VEAAPEVAVAAVWLVKAVMVVPPGKGAHYGDGEGMVLAAHPVEVAGALVEAPLERAAQPEVMGAPLGKGARREEMEAVLARAALDQSPPVNALGVAASTHASPAVPMAAAQWPVSVEIKVTERVSAGSR